MSFFKSNDSILQGVDHTKLSGTGNEGNISNTNHAKIQASNCKLQLDSCDYSKINIKSSTLQMDNCKYAKVQGENANIKAKMCRYLKVSSSDKGQLTLEANNYLTWNGEEGVADIKNDQHTKINGSKNNVTSNKNEYLAVAGNNNKVLAVESHYLKVQGNNNNVSSQRTRYVRVNGNNNNVKVEDILQNGIYHHILSRVMDKGANELTLQKSVSHVNIRGGGNNVSGNIVNGSVSVNAGGSGGIFVNGVDLTTIFGVNNSCGTGGTTNLNINNNGVNMQICYNGTGDGVDVILNYQDESSIVGNAYTSGIFQFQLNKLSNEKAQVVISNENIDEYKVEPMTEGNDSIVISGKKNGKQEELKINGSKVEMKNETEFEVSVKVVSV